MEGHSSQQSLGNSKLGNTTISGAGGEVKSQ
jgi:hypothetical protein